MIHPTREILEMCNVPTFAYTDEETLYLLLKVRERVIKPEAIKHLDAVIEIYKQDLDIEEDLV